MIVNKKGLFFIIIDCLSGFSQLKDVNNQSFNDIKDEKVREIFINIKKRIDSDA